MSITQRIGILNAPVHGRFAYIYICLILLVFSSSSAQGLRLISTSPQVTELCFQLGKGGDLVGTVAYSDFPLEAKAIPRIGTLFMPSLEQVFRYRPDWVLTDMATVPTSVMTSFKARGFSLFPFQLRTVNDLFHQSSEFLTRAYGENLPPAFWDAYIQFSQLKSKRKKPFRFLILVSFDPIIVAGHSSFLSDLFQRMGGENLAPSTMNESFPQLSMESLLRVPPDIIFYLAQDPLFDLGYSRLTETLWPKQPKKTVALPDKDFGRASLTAVRAATQLIENHVTH